MLARWCAALLLVFAACERGAPTDPRTQAAMPMRTRTELLDALHVYAAGGAAAEPAREEELAWIVDRATPIDDRLEQGMRLVDDTKAIMKRFVAADTKEGVATFRWTAATTSTFAYIVRVLQTEVVPTLGPNNPSDADRLERIAKVRLGAAGMLTGGLLMLSAQRGDIGGRRLLAATWARHIRAYTELWGPNGCTAPASAIGGVLAMENDVVIVVALQAIEQALGSCGAPL